MDSRDGVFRVPMENQTLKEFQFMGSWIPYTPKKNPMQGSSSVVHDERVIEQELSRGVPCGGYDLNYAVQGFDQNEVYNNGGMVNGNRMINGEFGLDGGMGNGSFNQSGGSRGGYAEFELDDLMNPDQTPFSFTSLLSGGDHLFQDPKYGTQAPASSRPLCNLNSPPRREAVGSVYESSFQPVPSTPILRRTGHENGFLEKTTATTGRDITEQNSGKGVETIVDSSVVDSTEVTEPKDGSRENDMGFDLNKTPQQKPTKKRRKFMPKVKSEAKTRKPRKPATQDNVKPKETGTGKRKKAQKTNLKESATKMPANVEDVSNTNPQVPPKSCRKALNFDSVKSIDVRQGDSESEIVQNASGSDSFSETKDATGGTSGSCLDSATQVYQTNGLVATNQLPEASTRNQPEKLSMGAKLPRVLQANHTQILARDQQPEELIGNQQCQVPMVNQNTQFPVSYQQPEVFGNQQCQVPVVNQNTQFPVNYQQVWLQMKNQLHGLPYGNQQPQMTMRNQQPCSTMGNQQPMYLRGAQRPVLTNGRQQPGGLQDNHQPIYYNQQTQQTCLPAGNQQYGSSTGMHQRVVSTGGQQHRLLNQQLGLLLRNQQPGSSMRSQQPGSSMRGQQPCAPLVNQRPGNLKGFTHLNPFVTACMSSPGLRPPHSQSQTPAANLWVESVSRDLIGTAGTCQRSIPEYPLQQNIRQGNGYIPFQGRSDGESVDVHKKTLSQNSSLPTPVLTKAVEARGSKRQYDRAMEQMQNHGLYPAGCWPLLQHISQMQDVERQNLEAVKKMKIQKGAQESLQGMPPAVTEIKDDPTDGARKDKNTASISETASKGILSLVKNSADKKKCVVPKTPKRKGPAGRKKSVPPPAQSSEIQVWEPPLVKKSSSRSKAKEKGKKSVGKSTGPSSELLYQDAMAEIVFKLQNLYLGDRTREQDQNALVLYNGGGAVVPYEKKRKPRPRVDLDDETTRVWNLLMGKGDADEEADKKKEKWWEEERRVFRGRADSFIARMHLVQGDRRFSPWKGSVVDSVIGVFLTQNVTDHLSSSAFMSLAARFPPKSNSNREDERHERSVVVEDPEGCILDLNDTPSQNPSDTEVSGVDSGSNEHQRNCSDSGIDRFNFFENSSQNLEEVLSSQDSFDPAIFQSCGGVGSCSGSKSDAEFSTTRCETNTVSGSAQSAKSGSPNLSDETCRQGNGRPILYEGSGDVQIRGTASVTQKKPIGDKIPNWIDSPPSFGQRSNQTNWQKEQTTLSSSYEQSTIQKPQVIDIEDFGMPGDGMGYSWLSMSPRAEKGNNKKGRVVRKGRNADPGSLQNTLAESYASNNEYMGIEFTETNATIVREMKGTLADGKKPTSQWDSLREDVVKKNGKKERSEESKDSIDYEAIRNATVGEIAAAIKERGMNNMLAVRIKDFLERIVRDHGDVDLEWLREVPGDQAKDYLLSIRGLGLKSVECIRLLTLHNLAFPVDTNVGRIAVRLGWVPLQPLPESLQLHLLELYPVLESIQKFLWPRLCKLDQRTLYELHYQLITFGKVFCTKSKPNCNACPMRGECRHFASAYASARLALPAPPSDERSLTSVTIPVPPESFPPASIPMMELPPPPLETALTREAPSNGGNCEPIIEEPASPEPECTEITESDIEYAYFNEDPDDFPTIKLNIEQFSVTLRDVMKRNMEVQEGDMSKTLVALNPATTYIPTAKLKNISRLRTEHQVYELPDSHPLLDGMDKRDRDDDSPYLLAIWTPGETANAAQPSEQKCGGKACLEETCSECNSEKETKSQTVRGTLLIPCRTANRGSFPLNGTYFQVNEVFADHDSSLKPINVPRDWIWNLPRRTVYFGTSVTSIFRGQSTEQIQACFWKGFICVRGFNQKTRAPRPLMARLHFPASKLKNNKT